MTRKEMVSLDYFMVQIQKKCDAVAGLKVQNIEQKKRIKQLENKVENLDMENQVLSKKLTSLNHDYNKLQKNYDELLKKTELKDDSYKYNNLTNNGVDKN